MAFLQIFHGLVFFQPQATHSIFPIAIPILINIVAIKYQNQHQSPFDTHPKTAFSGILLLLLYFLALDCHHRLAMQINRPLALDGYINRSARFLGCMAMAVLASLIFPDSASPVVYALHAVLSVGDVVVLVCWKMGVWLRKMAAEQENNDQGYLLPL